MQRKAWQNQGRGRTALAAIAVGTLLLSVACSDEPLSKQRGGPGGTAGSGSGAGSSGTLPAPPTCPEGLSAPASLATDADATDVRVVGGSIYFRAGVKVFRIAPDGTGRKELYTSPDLIRAYVSGKTLVVVESPDPPNAVLRIGDVDGDPGALTEIGTDLVAAGVVVFGADDTSAYAVADNAGGDTLYRVTRDGGIDVMVETGGVVSDPQLTDGALWYVKDQKEIYRLPLDGGEPALVTTVEGGCSLAVGSTHLFCATAGAVEQRDRSGANPTKLFDTSTSKLKVGFGPGVANGDSIVVRSSGDGPLKNVLRSVASGAERIIACGRDPIGALSVDGQSIAWTETGKGVFFTTLGPL